MPMRLSCLVQVVVALGVLAVTEVARSNPAPLSLPPGVTVASATAEQLGAAVFEAVKADPTRAAEIVAPVIAELKAGDRDKCAAVVSAALRARKNLDVLAFVCDASKANPSLASTIAKTAATIFPKLAREISRRATECAPGQARAIALAVAGIVPDERESIFLAVWQALGAGGPRVDLAALGFATGAGVNPANYVHGDINIINIEEGPQQTRVVTVQNVVTVPVVITKEQ
jgi:hypothetical protein